MEYTFKSDAIIRRSVRTIFLVSAISLFTLQIVDYLNFGVDDVFISMRVAENAADGKGLVLNTGENVEGYSNPLWVLLLSAGALLGLGNTHSELRLLWFAKGMSLFFGIGVLAILFRIAANYERGKESVIPLRYLVLLVATSCGPFVLWCCGGLESLITAFFLSLSILLFQTIWERKSNGQPVPQAIFIVFSLVLALAALTRPEPLLHALSAIGFIMYTLRSSITKREARFVILPFIIVYSIFILWRYLTYEDLLPNTFYAKTGGGLKSYLMSMKYILGGVCMVGGPLILAVPFIQRTRSSVLLHYCMVLVGASFVFMLYSGGDWMAGYRFFIPIAPIFFLAISVGISGMVDSLYSNASRKTILGRSRFLLFVLFLSFSTAFAGRILIRGQIQTMSPGFSSHSGHSSPWNYEVGAWIHNHANKSGIIATGEVGLIGYLNPSMRIIDLFGLADKHIARNLKHAVSADAEYVLDQKPDYIVLPSGDAQSVVLSFSRPTLSYYSAIANDKNFRSNYHIEKRFISLDLFTQNK
ncbi:MAG: hypothetical protein Q8916_07370 [Bacteroidota bacterium]|nr:hypothetical protein [Bacteroidota bacterium]MDP4230211.1 hypothetical protein [Bacteroidota bacterium]MDP4237525.1 hypothetical protein [Bacteroidota bacterium]